MTIKIVREAPKPRHRCDLPVVKLEKGVAYTRSPTGEIVQCESCLTYWISEPVEAGFYAAFYYWRKMSRFEVWRKVTRK